MNWEKLAKPLEELGKWFLNLGLLAIGGLIIQPFTKSNENFICLGAITALATGGVAIGLGLYAIPQKNKKKVVKNSNNW